MSKEKAIKIYEKNRKALEKIFKENSIKNLCVRDQSWLELHNWIVDLNSDYVFYEERNGDDTLITNGVVSAYIAKENRKETLEEKLDEYFLIEKDFKHQIKVGANGDAFLFKISLVIPTPFSDFAIININNIRGQVLHKLPIMRNDYETFSVF